MAYATSNPPKLLFPRVGSGQALWLYDSADIHTTVAGASYFSNGHDLGMRVGDVVIVSKNTATIGATIHTVQTVVAGGAATLAAAILA